MRSLAEMARAAERETHYRSAAKYARDAQDARRLYKKTLDRAIAKYGDTTHIVSGIYNADFPEAVKHRLRRLLSTIAGLDQASRNAYARTKKRTPWHNELGRVAKPAWSFY